MKKITLEQCNALPISELLIATIEEPMDSDDSNELIQNNPKLAEKVNKMTGQVVNKIEESISNAKTELMLEDLPEDAQNTLNSVIDAFLKMAVKIKRTAVVYKRSDGTYIDLNGYGNKTYKKESLIFVEPFSDYYTEGSFKFCEFSEEESDNPFMRGIGIDFDSLDGMERYEKKVADHYNQIESEWV